MAVRNTEVNYSYIALAMIMVIAAIWPLSARLRSEMVFSRALDMDARYKWKEAGNLYRSAI